MIILFPKIKYKQKIKVDFHQITATRIPVDYYVSAIYSGIKRRILELYISGYCLDLPNSSDNSLKITPFCDRIFEKLESEKVVDNTHVFNPSNAEMHNDVLKNGIDINTIIVDNKKYESVPSDGEYNNKEFIGRLQAAEKGIEGLIGIVNKYGSNNSGYIIEKCLNSEQQEFATTYLSLKLFAYLEIDNINKLLNKPIDFRKNPFINALKGIDRNLHTFSRDKALIKIYDSINSLRNNENFYEEKKWKEMMEIINRHNIFLDYGTELGE
jgi:hypothetical protein